MATEMKANPTLANRPWPVPSRLTTTATIVVTMPTTIQLDDERKARLSRLKVGAMTYDDVVAQLLGDVDEEAFRRRALEWEETLARTIRANPRNVRL